MMIAVINIGSILEYGRPTAMLKEISDISFPKSRTSSKKEERKDSDRVDVDVEEDNIKMGVVANGVASSTTIARADADQDGDLPVHLKLSLQLAFSMLSQALSRPVRRIPFQRDTLNPYITIILTFVSTAVKSDHWPIFERVIPWGELAVFLSSVPRSIIKLSYEAAGSKEPSIITAGCSPLPEDACLRGMAWGGRRIYERGFWNRGTDGRINEAAVLDVKEGEEVNDGIIEDDDGDDDDNTPRINDQDNRWIRVLRSGMRVAQYVDGFVSTQQPNGERFWTVEGRLTDRVASWGERWRMEREEDDMCRIRRSWDDSMDVGKSDPAWGAIEEKDANDEKDADDVNNADDENDANDENDADDENDTDNENDSEELKVFEVRPFSVIVLIIAIHSTFLQE